ncbi:MAG: acyl-CoA dehydrogenase family protein [Hyphomonadaceae bacterium]|nr:acyl-CoA dehydrogenase family protein [Hyphomonadaceae bacterium]
MDIDTLELTAEETAFREKVRSFYAEHLTPPLRRAAELTSWTFAEFEYGRQWQKILYKAGWGAPHWPVEYGGAGFTPRQRLIWELETARARPPEVMRMGRDYAAPCIMRFGTDEQKQFFLPKIIAGEDWWAQGYSEPGAGSDLASLKLSAVSDGDEYLLNGSKIWTTFAQHANRIFMLARTANMEKKQQGITFLLVDMNSPGIEVRPIINIAGEHEFNEIFFTDVRVPKSRRLGQEHEGWAVARYLLLFEHGAGIARSAAELKRRAGWVREIASLEQDGCGGALLDDPDFSRKLGLLEIGVEAADFAADQVIIAAAAGSAPGFEAELLNIRCRELDQSLTELAMEAIGYYAAPDQREARFVEPRTDAIGPPHVLTPTPIFFAQRGATIAGGTPDIHRNNLARHLLD